MHDDPNDREPSDEPEEISRDSNTRVNEKVEELRTHAQMAAVFEGGRKFEAEIYPTLDIELAREVQRGMAKLEKSKIPNTPVIKPEEVDLAGSILDFHASRKLPTNDYHIHRRPGETMIIRWLEGEQVDKFYERLQAHFDAAIEGAREDERQALEWKKDPQTLAYLDALDKTEVKMSDRYLREQIRQHGLFVLSTQTADEISITYLCDYLMGIQPAHVVGIKSAPPDGASEAELAWFFKMFALRGVKNRVEQMCFFTYLQKAEETFDLD